MFTIAWGQRAAELADRAATRHEVAVETAPDLVVVGASGAAAGRWRCWICGRLTNAAALRARFGLPDDCTDGAVITRAHERLGFDARSVLRGTFVVVALDGERGVTAVTRDQLGGRPLVYARVGAGAVLAEHERAIVEAMPSAPGPDRLALAQWIDQGTVPSGRTLFEGIERVPPGHSVVLSRDGISIESYWRPRYDGVASGLPEFAESLRAGAFDAVRRAAEGSRRPALRLSGGLDSACVAAALAARPAPAAPAIALGAVFPTHPETDERALIEATARHTGLPVEIVAFDDRASILAPALEHIERWRLPPATPNTFVWKPVMADARRLGVDVMLDGEGGDELFGCAPSLIADMLRAGRVLAAWHLTGRIPGVGAEAGPRLRLRALRIFGVSPLVPPAVKRLRGSSLTRDPGSLLLHADSIALHDLDDRKLSGALDGPRWWRSLASELVGACDLLGASSHHRRESVDEMIDRRQPFLFDVQLLETVLSGPPELGFDSARDRAVLRDALAGWIPEAVRTRYAKSFFTGLLPSGLQSDGPRLAAALASRDAPVRAFVSSAQLEQVLRRWPGADIRAARRLWQAGLADAWLRSL